MARGIPGVGTQRPATRDGCGTTRNSCSSRASSSTTTLSSRTGTTTSSNTSSSTIWGPGALSGKAIRAFGKKALKFGEALVISGRLEAISANFPHTNETPMENVEQMYDDVLELSREGYYSTQIRQQALRLIMVQISHGQVRHLVRAIGKWPQVEICIFLSEILKCMPTQWTGFDDARQKMYDTLENVYETSQRSHHKHGAVSLLRFMTSIARADASSCQAVIDAGVLDMLLRLHLRDFASNSACNIDDWSARRQSLHTAWESLLSAIAEDLGGHQIFSCHPLYRLLPKRMLLPLPMMIRVQIEARREAWRSLDDEFIRWRLHTIRHLSLVGRDLIDQTTEIFDVFIDLLEFSNPDVYDASIFRESMRLLLDYIGHRFDRRPPSKPYDHAIDSLWRIICNNEHISTRIPFESYLSSLDNIILGKMSDPTSQFLRVMDGFARTRHVHSQTLYLVTIIAVPLYIFWKEFLHTPSSTTYPSPELDLKLQPRDIPRPLYNTKLLPSKIT